MKKSLSLFFTLPFLVIVLIIGCKKDNNQGKDYELTLAKSKAWAATQSTASKVIMNLKMENYYEDVNGRRMPSRPLRTGPGCAPEFSNPEVSLEYWVAANPNCESNTNYQLRASFIIYSENAIVYENPNNTSQKTRGRLVITTSSGTTLLSNQNILPVTITNLGPDPNDNTRSMYRVEWVNSSVPGIFLDPSNKMRLGLYYFTECEEEMQYPYAPVTDWLSLTLATECNVVSPVHIDPQSYFIHGVAAASSCQPDIVPLKQEVEFSRSGFGVWSKQIGPYESFLIPATDLPRGYTYSVRYRNIAVVPGSNPQQLCYGPWLTPSISQAWP